ncbi:MAG: M28 family peptidase [Candidatus Thorarchaeota archaeon]
MCIPVIALDDFGTDQKDIIIPSQEIQQTERLPRVYGVDYTQDIFPSITESSFENYVYEITDNGTRHALDATDALNGSNYKARQYLKYIMNNLSAGRMEIQVIGKHMNVIGKLPGYLPGDNPSFVIAGHYDSWYASHGANEGAAGLAALLELIDVFSDYEWPLDIYFIAANARYVQWGPYGSAEVANWMMAEGIDPLALYTLEALLVQDPYAAQDERLEMVYLDTGPANYHLGAYWAELTVAMSKNYGINRINAISHNEFNYWGTRYMSHTYYYERGYHSTLVGIESGFAIDTAIRTTNDIASNPDYRYYLGSEMTAAIGGSIAFTMSRAYGEPIRRNINLELGIGRTQNYYIPISAPTSINVSSRWFGSNTTFALFDPNDNPIASQEYGSSSPWDPTDIFSEPVTQPGLYRLNLQNIGESNIGYDLQYSYDSDIDGNGVMDSQEYWLDTALFEQDTDEDSLSDADEIIIGSDPENPDSDTDSMPDAWEVEYGLDPVYAPDAMTDADNDGLSNLQEYVLGLNPLSSDTDSDLIPDAWEVEYGLNPLLDDSLEDPDEDEKSNLQEYLDGSNPMIAEREVMTIPVVWIAAPSLVIVAGGLFYAWTKHRERTWTEH